VTTETTPAPKTQPATAARPRAWPALVLVGLFWASFVAFDVVPVSIFVLFLSRLAGCVLLLLLFSAWWLFFNRRVPRAERWLTFGTAIVGGVAAALVSGEGANLIGWLLLSLPVVFTAWAAWLLLARWMSPAVRCLGLVAVVLVTWGAFDLVRTDGLWGTGQMALRWRWARPAEDLYLEELAQRQRAGEAAAVPLKLLPGDWPGFRGPDRDGVAHGIKIRTDWETKPPRLVWQQRIGPAWSSLVIVGDRLFTQEQRGPAEAVVCLDAATGREVWAHTETARFWDGQAGAGPRATPTLAEGRLYALGATGMLNCLDPATGKRLWSHDIATDAGAKAPIWGFSSSPLVAEGMVIVFAGGGGDKGLLAYRADSGKLAWSTPQGPMSYSSAQRAVFGDQTQVLFLGQHGLTALAPASGKVLWEYANDQSLGLPRCTQPQQVGKDQVLFGSEPDGGTVLLDVARKDKGWSAAPRWSSRRLKPSFSDFVVCGNAVYGFDSNVFCCLDLKTGQRRWKDGRYGNGQVLLLADQPLLVVVTETGEAVLVATDPDRHQELGRFQAIEGKTWNHPVIAHGRLYVRNAEKIACYDVAAVDADGTARSGR
jgi:outer membrane protein assembly factor BamB